MIAAKSSDFHTFAYIRFFSTLSKKKYYNDRAICGIPIIQTGLSVLLGLVVSTVDFYPVDFCVKKNKQDLTVYLHYRLKYYKEGTYIILSWKTSLFQLLA